MSRKEAQNSFNDSLIMDLNPINTPNTVLTDNLNGTIITYNGNEYTLQNDMGNYPLKNCKLKKNYIPVGVKEYGDILYIASYNPIENKFELGSYPSPKTISGSDDGSQDIDIKSILSQITNSTIDYSDIVEYQKMAMFISFNAEEWKLNPGDKYQFQIENLSSFITSQSRYETLEYFIVDEDKKSYNITDLVKSDNFPVSVNNNNGYKYVSWKNPGWFAVQPRFAEIDEFKVNVKRFTVPPYASDAHIKLNFQITSSDRILTEHPETATGFFVTLKITTDIHDEPLLKTIELTNYKKLNNGTVIFYADYDSDVEDTIIVENVSGNATVQIEVEPQLSIESSKTVTFENLNKKLVFNTNQKGNVSDFAIGQYYWWYGIDKNTKKLSLKFDTSGIAQSSVMDSDVYLKYTIKSLDKGTLPEYTNVLLNDWNIIGDTIVDFDLADYNSTTHSNNKLFAENIYVIEFNFYDSLAPGSSVIRTAIQKVIIASELMNGFTDSRYDLIPFDRWMGRYGQSAKNTSFIVTEATIDPLSGVIDSETTKSENYQIWKDGNDILTNCGGNDYRTFVPDIEDLSDGFTVSAGYTYDATIKYKTEFEALHGPMWDDLITNADLRLNDASLGHVDIYTGKKNTVVTEARSVSVSKSNKYKLQQQGSQKTLWNYSIKNITYPGSETYNLTYTGKVDHNPSAKVGALTHFSSTYRDEEDYKLFSYNPDSQVKVDLYSKWIPGFVEKLNKISYDCGYITITPRLLLKGGSWIESWGEYVSVKLYTGNEKPDTGTVLSVAQGENSGTQEYTGAAIKFIVFKTDYNQPMLVRIADYSNFESWASWVEHVVCDEYNSLRGAFYLATKVQTPNEDSSFTFDLHGSFIPTSWEYSNKNMLSSERESLLSNYSVETNNFSISGNSINSINAIQEITLTPYSGSASAPTSFGQQIDTLLEAADTEIENHNQLVTNEFASAYNDDIFSTNYTATSDVYRYKAGVPTIYNNVALLAFLNKTNPTGYAPLKTWTTRTDLGNKFALYTILGYYSSTNV